MSDEYEIQLADDMASFEHDPLGFVLYTFPWNEGELKGKAIESWQREILEQLGNGVLNVSQAVRLAVASGHGIGKSALVAWIILWSLSTKVDTKGIVTANTETQLKTKTWSELAKWYRLSIMKHWFVFKSTALFSADKAHEKTWRVDMIPWSENNTEAFAGLHNQGKRVVLIFDEASAIPDVIWEVSEGALTDEGTEIIWCAFGNPTRNIGRFKECFTRYKHRWQQRQIDSRKISFTNKKQIDEWIEDYGIDSDFVKVRVRGEFPAVGDNQFISSIYVDLARGKHIDTRAYTFAPSIIGVDPAWDGGDKIVIAWRQGNISKILATYAKNDDDFVLAQNLIRFEDEYKADAVFIDFGYGTGLYSAGKQLGRKWTLVQFGGASSKIEYVNKRTEMWGDMRGWLRDGGVIPDDSELCQELISPEYYTAPTGPNIGKIMLEKKADMKERGIGSTNKGDALALTFAFKVRKKEHNPLLKGNNTAGRKDYAIIPRTKMVKKRR